MPILSSSSECCLTASGRGTPLLVFNGGPGADDYLGPVAEMIDDLCRVIRFEPRGCGRSDWDGIYDVDTLLADAEAVRREYGAERCIVAGHSFGPSAALAYALLPAMMLTYAAQMRGLLADHDTPTGLIWEMWGIPSTR